jgi:hypothetical protein
VNENIADLADALNIKRLRSVSIVTQKSGTKKQLKSTKGSEKPGKDVTI